ncbi:MAG: tetratricopeptide repeat protein [Treponema sp.]|nr:tetratricopeptide repeat protein [Treponema sp.]
MNSSNHLSSVAFVKLPDDFKFKGGTFKIDTTIPLPVQFKDGEDASSFSAADITEEQILSGILTVLAWDKSNANLEYYRSLIKEVRPNLMKELGEAAILKTRDEDWELAEEIYMALRGYDPENKALCMNMALFYDQRADSYRRSSLHDDADACDDLAKNYYNEAMNAEPEIPDAFFNAAFFFLKQHDFSKAKSCFENYIALTSDLKDDELGENGVYKKERAQEMIDKIANRNLENSHYHKAYAFISEGRLEPGLDEIRKFIQENPAAWNGWFILGWGLRLSGRFAEAKEAFLKARECDGGDENADFLNELAICYLETGELEEARKVLHEALVLDTENTKVISNLGCLELKLGNKDEALKYFRTVLEIDPSDKIALSQVELLQK